MTVMVVAAQLLIRIWTLNTQRPTMSTPQQSTWMSWAHDFAPRLCGMCVTAHSTSGAEKDRFVVGKCSLSLFEREKGDLDVCSRVLLGALVSCFFAL